MGRDYNRLSKPAHALDGVVRLSSLPISFPLLEGTSQWGLDDIQTKVECKPKDRASRGPATPGCFGYPLSCSLVYLNRWPLLWFVRLALRMKINGGSSLCAVWYVAGAEEFVLPPIGIPIIPSDRPAYRPYIAPPMAPMSKSEAQQGIPECFHMVREVFRQRGPRRTQLHSLAFRSGAPFATSLFWALTVDL